MEAKLKDLEINAFNEDEWDGLPKGLFCWRKVFFFSMCIVLFINLWDMLEMENTLLQANRGTASSVLLCNDTKLQLRVSSVRKILDDGLCHCPEVGVVSLVWTGQLVIWHHVSIVKYCNFL